jgi:hypothetical protein
MKQWPKLHMDRFVMPNSRSFHKLFSENQDLPEEFSGDCWEAKHQTQLTK